jgi:hypothetical protein
VVTQSDADRAYLQFKKILEQQKLFRDSDPKLSEADTRAKLIDPLFREVLGWAESEITREQPVDTGYSDYILGSDVAHLLLEAKRTKPRFRIEAPGKSRKLLLDGPHLLGQRKLKPWIQQAQRYASSLGASFAILTNGSQFIIFRPYLPGRSWTTGTALVFHDHQDILQDFAFFFRLLCRDSVCSGELFEAFSQIEGITTELHAPIQFFSDPDQELVRNPFWAKISAILGPLFTDNLESPALQEEIILNCYVTTPLSDQADKSLDRRIRDTLPRHLKDARVIEEAPGSGRRSAFSRALEEQVVRGRPGTYLLTGGVGSGKTTFLRRFPLVNTGFVKEFCIWVHIDFLTIGNVSNGELDFELRKFVYSAIRKEIARLYPAHIPSSGVDIRDLFSEDLHKAELTRLYSIPRESPEWTREANSIVDELYRDDSVFTSALLKRFVVSSLRPVFVLDNTDQLGEAFQERVFLLAQKLSQDHQALLIVALREEKFFAAFRRGIFDAFGDRRFHIGSPNMGTVLRRRLDYGRQKFAELMKAGHSDLSSEELTDIDALLEVLIRSTTRGNTNIVRMLACVSNGDMRHALDMFREFVGSGNTNIRKIIEIGRGYTVAFHEFAKSAILGSRKYYRSNVSHVANLFKLSGSRRASHLTALRILARLSRTEESASAHGEGFLKTKTLLHEYRESFGTAEDLQEWTNELLLRGLIESEPPRAMSIDQTEAPRITASGAYYWKYLSRSFAYIDLVFVDTPVANKELARKLAHLAMETEMPERFNRVRLFMGYLARKEEEELLEVSQRTGPFREALVPQIIHQVEDETDGIRRKASTRRSAWTA